MRLTVFNGSPRAKRSNTRRLLDAFLSGFQAVEGNEHDSAYLASVRRHEEFADRFWRAEYVLLAFPLYVDAMPGLVKRFIEALVPMVEEESVRRSRPGLVFLVHSGFPEVAHSRYVERYLARLSRRLRSRYLGTIVRGLSEPMQTLPAWLFGKPLNNLFRLGRAFGRTGRLDDGLVARIAGPQRLDALTRAVWRLGLPNLYWHRQLKQNGAFARRFARPYEGCWPNSE